MAGRIQQIIFRIFYSTSFTIVFLVTIGACCAGPIDALYQSYLRGRLIDIFLLTGAYAVVGIVSIFLYSSRLYTNRSILKDIPKSYLPVEKSDLPGKRIWRLIEDCKSRSAVIAYQARPRARRIEKELPQARERINTLLKPEHSKEYQIFEPQWGVINHPGWSSPGAKELPNLQYETVVGELTDLIEARAVSLIPVTQDGTNIEGESSMASAYAIEALRRPEEIGMRQYVAQLISLGVLDDNSLNTAFLTSYERARFAPNPVTEDEFKTLMRIFAEVLRTMKPLDVDQLDDPVSPKDFNETRTRDLQNVNAKDSLESSSLRARSDDGSVRHYGRPSPPRMSHDSVRSFTSQDQDQDPSYAREQMHERGNTSSWTAPTSRPPFLRAPSSRRTVSRNSKRFFSSRSSNRDRSHSSQPTFKSSNSKNRELDKDDSMSAKSGKSSASGGSVIRLKRDFDTSREGLPFVITVPTVERSAPPRDA